MVEGDVLRVLSVAHTAVSRTAGRLRYNPLLARKDMQIRLIVPKRWHQFGRWYQSEPPQEGDVDTKAMPIVLPRAGRAHWYLHLYPGLMREVRRFRPDVLHLWEEPWSLVALQASLLARWHGIALVLEVDQNILKTLPPPFETIRRSVLARTDLLLSRTRLAYDVARACGYRGPSIQIGYGVDDSLFHPGRRWPRQMLHVGYVGRLIVEKGVDDLLDGIAGASSPVRATILGDGPHEAKLRERAAALGIADRVTFRSWTTPDKVAELLRDLDLLALLTRTTSDVREQFGRVIIEAQACGTPVIGSTSGAIPDIVGEGGWIVPEQDPGAVTALLDRLHAEPAELEARRALSLSNVAERFTHAGVADQLRQSWVQAYMIRAGRSHAVADARESRLTWLPPP